MSRPADPESLYSRVCRLLDEKPHLTANAVAHAFGVPRSKVAPYVTRYKKKVARAEGRALGQAAAEKAKAKARALASSAEVLRAAVKATVQSIAPEAAAAPEPPSAAPEPPPSIDPDEIERIKARVKDPDQRLDLIAELVARAKDETALRGILEIHAMQIQAGQVSTLPPPTNAEEQIARAARINQALGREAAQRAFDLAFMAQAAPSETEASEELPADAAALT